MDNTIVERISNTISAVIYKDYSVLISNPSRLQHIHMQKSTVKQFVALWLQSLPEDEANILLQQCEDKIKGKGGDKNGSTT